MNTIITDLHNIDVVFDDENLAIFFFTICVFNHPLTRILVKLYFRRNRSSDGVENTLIQRHLIEKQLTHSSNDAKNRNRFKSKTSNKSKTCHYCQLKMYIKKDC